MQVCSNFVSLRDTCFLTVQTLMFPRPILFLKFVSQSIANKTDSLSIFDSKQVCKQTGKVSYSDQRKKKHNVPFGKGFLGLTYILAFDGLAWQHKVWIIPLFEFLQWRIKAGHLILPLVLGTDQPLCSPSFLYWPSVFFLVELN